MQKPRALGGGGAWENCLVFNGNKFTFSA